jgi:chemotaxis protein MotB
VAAAAARTAAEERVATLEAELAATAAAQPLAAPEAARPLDSLLDVDAATRQRLAALAAELAELRAETEAQRAALADQEAAAATRAAAISAQLGESLQRSPAEARAAASAAVQRESRLTGDLLARIGGHEDVDLVSGRSVGYTVGLVFDSGEAELSPESQAELNRIAVELRRLIDDLPDDLPWMLRVDGHTDDLPVRRGRFRSNWELSAARASTVAQYLIDWGIPADRLIAAGFADSQPLVEGRTDEARRQNRRIELRLTVR